jgi:hypothetical protein
MAGMKMKDAEKIIRAGGFVRLTWATGQRDIVYPNGAAAPLDGRTYQPLVRMLHTKKRTGSIENKYLVI